MTQASSQSGSPRALGGLAAVFRWAEMVFFFFVLPGVAALAVDPRRRGEGVLRGVGLGFLYELPLSGARLLLPMLVLFTLAVVVWLLLDPTFDRRRLWNAAGVRGEWKRMAVLFAVGAGVMLAAAWGLDRFGGGGGEDGYAFLGLARRSPRLLVV
ncbi:MAG TPA: hypothetical protein ENK11_00735, partial [Phycisphaerales bacterium]|nr:hypothetical protein [Phycisphaerales bacterium]